MNEELKQFNIDINDIQESNDLIDNIHEAIHQMSLVTMKDRFEVVLNNNLIEFKEKATNYRTIFGCRISYDNLPKDVSFIVREDTEPSYKDLQTRWNSLRELIEKEKTRLAKECSHTYEDSLGKTELVNEDIFNELNKILDKMNELEGVDNE